jgi:chlorite dismutase
MNRPQETPRRQFVSFSFFRLLPEWRRLPLQEREDQRREFAETVRKWNVAETMRVLTYSLVGMRADTDMLLWRICYSASCLQEMSADLLRTRMGGYLESPYSFLGMTRRSEYLISEHERESLLHGVVRPGGCSYLMVYPMVRTRAWYALPFEDRQRMVQEMVRLNHEFPGIHPHVVYSFGLGDQDFVIAVETDQLDQLVDRMMRLYELETSTYIERLTPVFTCVKSTIEDMLERIG